MVEISTVPGDKTLAALRHICEQIGNSKERRDYLGASLIGDDCVRKVWYDYNKYERKPFGWETLWNFEDGHRTEDLIADRLRLVPGLQLWTHDDAGRQFGFSDLDGKFKGHFDGVIRGLPDDPDNNYLWENKASAQKKFAEFQKAKQTHGDGGALKQWNAGYYAQAQLYMHYTKIHRHYLTVALAGGRDLDSCITLYDQGMAEFYIQRAKLIIGAKEPLPRISDKPDWYQCKMCDFRGVCHANST